MQKYISHIVLVKCWILDRSTISGYYSSEMSSASSTTSVTSTNVQKESNDIDIELVKWEEFALCLEEHFHALEMFQRKPAGKPMGHR